MQQLLLKSIFTEQEFTNVEKVFHLKEINYEKVFLTKKFFMQDLLKLKREIPRNKFKKFLNLLRMENVEFEYEKSRRN